MPRDCLAPRPVGTMPERPFTSAEEAWFWFMQSHEALHAGARLRAGEARVPRPCEPVDVLRVVERLYRQRRLLREHLAVLGHYGRRVIAPDPRRRREQRARALWDEAIDRIEPPLRGKGIVQ